jgi:DNA-binding response OmpR family regulator
VQPWRVHRPPHRQVPSDAVAESGPIRLDADRHRCYVDADEIALIAKEFELGVRSTFSVDLPAPPD